MEYRKSLHARYESFAVALQACHVQLPSLRPTNYARSITHVFFGALAVAFVEFIPWSWAQITIFSITGFAWFLEITRRFSEPWNNLIMKAFGPIAHPHERYHVNSSTWYATALTILALTDLQTACVCAVVALGFGDPAAALVGRKFGRHKLVNNRSLEGTVTFAVVSSALLFAVLTAFHTDLGMGRALGVAVASSVAGALAELFSRRLDDNFTIPLVSGLVAWAILSFL
jgi:dolichol kinase